MSKAIASERDLPGHAYFRPSQVDYYVHGHVKRLLDKFQLSTCERHWDRAMDALGARRDRMREKAATQKEQL